MTDATIGEKILGIDPGLNITGYGVLEITASGPKLREGGVIRGGSDRSLEARLRELYTGLNEVLDAFQPAAMAIEELYSHYERPRTAILMGHARGVLCLAAAQRDIPIMHYASTQVKRMLTGNGRAPKNQMQLAICRELGLAAPPEPPDVADALAIALCHHHLGRKVA
ncbi:MAG: crossover junction endodeoxyribonuclease RuvC [Planctomycetota bacterium]|nr:crossover junction endodeoxyribonuclease RuvC [Planctomycetota bacterium]